MRTLPHTLSQAFSWDVSPSRLEAYLSLWTALAVAKEVALLPLRFACVWHVAAALRCAVPPARQAAAHLRGLAASPAWRTVAALVTPSASFEAYGLYLLVAGAARCVLQGRLTPLLAAGGPVALLLLSRAARLGGAALLYHRLFVAEAGEGDWAAALRGIAPDAALPLLARRQVQPGEEERCTICHQDLQPGEAMAALPCHAAHEFHEACILQWLRRRRHCPLCNAEVQPQAPR